MRVLSLCIALLGGGCDFIWRIDHLPAGDDAAARDDASTTDVFVPDAPPGCTVVGITLPALADAYIWQAQPSSNWGSDDLVQISSSMQRRGMWRFALPYAATAQTITSLELDLPFAKGGGTLCGGTCSTCVDQSGIVDVFPMRDDWFETEVTWDGPDASHTWTAPGASAVPDDHGAIAAIAAYSAGQDVAIVFTTAVKDEAVAYLTNHQLAFLATSASATFDVPARAYDCFGSGATQLVVKYCQ